MSQKIRIKLKSFDHNLVDKSAEKIVKTVKATGAVVSGPIPLPTHKRIFTVNRSTFVNKKSREQFELSSYKRLIDIYNSNNKTVEALMKLELASGVEVEIKVWWTKDHIHRIVFYNKPKKEKKNIIIDFIKIRVLISKLLFQINLTINFKINPLDFLTKIKNQ